ncbi:DUF1569 domain-containing protein [Roseimaritima ulvae]|uniref:DinB superfamily protein n=1 Tax=Roseimaritima ulvae TaxID=980254 RepID=A0A5B9QTB7_9BACT|nr:DUF1569 domain-containing protein [Roseimaritima ulvae]QEG42307.1 hypothetical protein UC8_43410 [Roseimaritima ulvae]
MTASNQRKNNRSRRELKLDHLDDCLRECRRLLQTGYERRGNWSLAQICAHVRLTIEASLDGYPSWMTTIGYPLRPLLRRFMLPRLLAGNSPSGVKTAGMFVPPADLDDAAEVDKFARCVERFRGHSREPHAHPGFGKMNLQEFGAFHAAHAAHHLSFLAAADLEADGQAS